MNRLTLTLVVLGSLLLSASAAEAQLRVVATTPDLAAITRAVVGDGARVDVLAAPTEDAHYVDAKPSFIITLNRADALVANGLELEIGWLPALQAQARNRQVIVGGAGFIDASTFVEPMQVPAARVDRSMGDVHPGGNPHFCFDPRRAVDVARGVAATLANLDPARAAVYRESADAFVEELRVVIERERARFQALPDEARRVVVYHDSMVYLLDWLGVSQVATLEPRPGVPPDPSHVANVLTTMRETGTRVILQEEYYPRSTSSTVARVAGGELVVIPGGTRFSDGQTYTERIETVASLLFEALSR